MLGHIFFFGFAFPLPSSLPELLPSDLNRWVCICKLSWRPLLTYFPLSLTGYLPSVIYVGYRNGGVRDEYRHTPKQWGGLTGSSGKLSSALQPFLLSTSAAGGPCSGDLSPSFAVRAEQIFC